MTDRKLVYMLSRIIKTEFTDTLDNCPYVECSDELWSMYDSPEAANKQLDRRQEEAERQDTDDTFKLTTKSRYQRGWSTANFEGTLTTTNYYIRSIPLRS